MRNRRSRETAVPRTGDDVCPQEVFPPSAVLKPLPFREPAPTSCGRRPTRVTTSPAVRSRAALERTNDPSRDPAAVEAAGLRRHYLAVHGAGVHERRVDSDMAADRLCVG